MSTRRNRKIGLSRKELGVAGYMRAYRAHLSSEVSQNTPPSITATMKRLGLDERPPAGSACQVCGYITTGTIGKGRGKQADLLVPDHDHLTGELRGWLCSRCNRALGLIGDSLEDVMKFVRYLEGST